MILASLARYYRRLAAETDNMGNPKVPPYGFSEEKIGWILVLDKEGRLKIAVPNLTADKKPQPKLMSVPRPEKRTSGIKPNFLWDKTAGALPAKHAFNRRMQPCNRGGVAANQTQALKRFVAFQAACPQSFRGFAFMDKCGRFFKRKCDVGIKHFGRQIFGSKMCRLPVLQKTAQGLQAFIVVFLQ